MNTIREKIEKFGIKMFRHGEPNKSVKINGLWFDAQADQLEALFKKERGAEELPDNDPFLGTIKTLHEQGITKSTKLYCQDLRKRKGKKVRLIPIWIMM